MANKKTVSLKKFNVEHVLRPVYYYSRFSAQWPFSIIYDSNAKVQRARVGFFEMLWPILMICFTIGLAFTAYDQLKSGLEEHVIPIRTVVGEIFGMCTPLFVAIEIVLNLMNRKKLVDVLETFKTFDNEVRQMFKGFSIQHWTHGCCTLCARLTMHLQQ